MRLPRPSAIRFTERPNWGPWVTPRSALTTPIHRWFTFPHSFSGELVKELLDDWRLGNEDVVLDPFVGAGTTLLACSDAGIRSIGADLSPLALLVSRVKSSPPTVESLQDAWDRVFPKVVVADHRSSNVDPFLDRAFPGKRLSTLEETRRAILRIHVGTREKEALLLALIAVLPRFSRLVRKGGWLAERSNSLISTQLRGALDEYVKMMMSDLDAHEPSAATEVIAADARRLPLREGSISAVITSPPYPNRHDYTRVFGVELQFAFLDWEGARALRYQSFHSHPEARPDRPPDGEYVEPESLSTAVRKIGAITNERRLAPMLNGYFKDLYLSLREVARVLKPGGTAALVLGNVQFCGVPIDVDRLTAEIGAQTSLQVERILVARRRGNSAQQMKQHGRRPQRESVVILKRN